MSSRRYTSPKWQESMGSPKEYARYCLITYILLNPQIALFIPICLTFELILKHCFFHKSRTVTHLATVSLKMFSRGLLLRRHCLVAYLQFIYNIILSYIEGAWHGDFICACTCMYNILCKRRNILCQTLLESLKYNMLIYVYEFIYARALFNDPLVISLWMFLRK